MLTGRIPFFLGFSKPTPDPETVPLNDENLQKQTVVKYIAVEGVCHICSSAMQQVEVPDYRY